jgi:hypothetical protein
MVSPVCCPLLVGLAGGILGYFDAPRCPALLLQA